MSPNEGKLSSGPVAVSFSKTSQPIGSHVVTLNPVLNDSLKNPPELLESNLSEYHLTARITNSSLSQRDLSLILDVLNYQVVTFGANFSMILALTELTMRLSGGRRNEEISDSRIRLTVSVSQILIGAFKDSEFSLYSGEYVEVSSQIKELLKPYLMSKRTYGSRFRTWRPEKFIRVRAVPVNTLTERNSSSNERYSGYCKGYGESHGNAHKEKTKPDWEIDGDNTGPEKEERNLFLRCTDVVHQMSNQLWIKLGILREGN